jgi:hypothetical protein
MRGHQILPQLTEDSHAFCDFTLWKHVAKGGDEMGRTHFPCRATNTKLCLTVIGHRPSNQYLSPSTGLKYR